MRFEWDDLKNEENLKNHGLSFELAAEVFDDPLHLLIPDRVVDGEERLWAIGALVNTTIVVVVHTCYLDFEEFEEEVVRIISARKAERHERKTYEEDTQ